MMTLRQTVTWYKSTIPVLITTCWEDEIIRQFALANGTSEDFFAAYYQNPLRGTVSDQSALDEFKAHLDDTKWSSLAQLVLFSKESHYLRASSVSYLNRQNFCPKTSWSQDVFWMEQWLEGYSGIRLPIWMSIIKRFGILNRLNLINCNLDDGWFWPEDEDTQEPTVTISAVDHIGWDNQQDWGNLIPSQLTLYDQDTSAHRIKRHNIMIWDFAKRCAWRPLWDATLHTHVTNAAGYLKPDVNYARTQRGKWAALALFQSIIWCRLNYYRQHGVTQSYMKPYMVSPEIQDPWVRTIATKTEAGQIPTDRAILTYKAQLTQSHSQEVRQSYRFPHLLGNGSLVADVWCDYLEKKPNQALLGSAYSPKFGPRLKYIMSAGLVPYSMGMWLRSLPRPKHPAIDEIYGGLVAIDNPESRNPLSRNAQNIIAQAALSDIRDSELTLTVWPDPWGGQEVKEGPYYVHKTILSDDDNNLIASLTYGDAQTAVLDGMQVIYPPSEYKEHEAVPYFAPDTLMFAAYPTRNQGTNYQAIDLPHTIV